MDRQSERSEHESLLRYWELEDALVGGELWAVLEARGMEVQWTCAGLHVQRGGKEFALARISHRVFEQLLFGA